MFSARHTVKLNSVATQLKPSQSKTIQSTAATIKKKINKQTYMKTETCKLYSRDF